MDFRKIYNLEQYIFEDIKTFFQDNGYLTAKDFFCIIIWKANRAKSKIANLIKQKRQRNESNESFEELIKRLTQEISLTEGSKEKMRVLITNWGFSLPTASAILSALYPEEFTVYDIRVTGILEKYKSLNGRKNFDNLWSGYEGYKLAVINYVKDNWILRDKDRYIWGESFYRALIKDIENEMPNKAQSNKLLQATPNGAPERYR